jgi:hypothetical protein
MQDAQNTAISNGQPPNGRQTEKCGVRPVLLGFQTVTI